MEEGEGRERNSWKYEDLLFEGDRLVRGG